MPTIRVCSQILNKSRKGILLHNAFRHLGVCPCSILRVEAVLARWTAKLTGIGRVQHEPGRSADFLDAEIHVLVFIDEQIDQSCKLQQRGNLAFDFSSRRVKAG